MSSTGSSSLLKHLKFLRFSGIFPTSLSGGSATNYSSSIPLTLLSVISGLSYTIALFDGVRYTLLESTLSRALTVVPYTVAAFLSDCIIRSSSFWFREQFSDFLALTDRPGLRGGKPHLLKYFWALAIFYSGCLLVHLIGLGVVYPEIGVSATTFKSGSDWDRLLALWISSTDFLHGCTVLSALCFLVIFGRQTVSYLDGFCNEILQQCKVASQPCIVAQVAKNEMLKKAIQDGNNCYSLADMFKNVKVAFGIYSMIGGTFIFALVLDVGTWLFYLACTILFRSSSAVDPFYYVLIGTYCLSAIINLCVIAEYGHQITRQVSS